MLSAYTQLKGDMSGKHVGNFPIRDKIILITGGGSGIGFALVQQCLTAGAKVVVGDLTLTADAEAFFSSTDETKERIAFKQTDVCSWNDLHDLITFSHSKFGQVPDIYAPVAGIFEPPWSNFWDDTEQNSYKTMEINVNHPIKLTRLAIRALVGANKQGVVCLTASTAAIRGNYLASLYSASKFAVLGFTKSMGQADYDEGVKVVCVCPGLVDSPLWRNREDDLIDQAKFHDRKAIFPKDIAEVMMKMIQSEEYEGGTCVVKTPYEEKIIERGWRSDKEKYDPSPRPDADNRRIKAAIDKERGQAWMPR